MIDGEAWEEKDGYGAVPQPAVWRAICQLGYLGQRNRFFRSRLLLCFDTHRICTNSMQYELHSFRPFDRG